MQDYLGLGAEARMNVPGTAQGNWRWRMKPGEASPEPVSYTHLDVYKRQGPKSVNRVTITSVNGKDFDPKATYVVVTNDFRCV